MMLEEQHTHRFQVDLRGVIDLLSQHLYSSPDVFVRELLQNCVDAIEARGRSATDEPGQIEIELISVSGAPPTLAFHDNGVGLTESEVHQFLATIGRSSKRLEFSDRPGDFIGRFGIGLLAAFMVSDEVVVITRSAREGNHPAIEWRGKVDGTYSVRELSQEVPCGTQVYVRANEASAAMFRTDRLLRLLTKYGEYLTPRIQYTSGDVVQIINRQPPWLHSGLEERLACGKEAFHQEFWDAIPLRSTRGAVEGVAYVLRTPTPTRAQHSHRIYLKNMLLSEHGEELLPEWAFFVQCIVNTDDLRPTASRESLYHDECLEAARDEISQCIRGYLFELAQTDPDRLRQLISIHELAIKALAVSNEDCLHLFAPWLPVETTQGPRVLGDFLREGKTIRYVKSRDDFRQLCHLIHPDMPPIVNAGYIYDAEIMLQLADLFPESQVRPFHVEELSDRFDALTAEEDLSVAAFRKMANEVLEPFRCQVEIGKFSPENVPVLYSLSDEAALLRSIDESEQVANTTWSAVLGGIRQEIEPCMAQLHLNFVNPIIRQVCRCQDLELQRRCVGMLYVQALLMGHHPLKKKELELMNSGVLGVLEWAVNRHVRAEQ
jgi:molecular chaperone HtpG